MNTSFQQPLGPALDVNDITEIRLRVNADTASIDTTTLSLTFTSARQKVLTAITGGAVQAGWTGVVQSDIPHFLGGYETVYVIFTAWPSEITDSAQLWTVTATATEETLT
jgi:hypothetical protein